MAALYTIERETGFSVQTNLLTVWIAATTYFTAVLGILAILLTAGDDLDNVLLKAILMSTLPLPACALAGYHLNLFGIGLIHSNSIELLEQELVNEATDKIQVDYFHKQIGSRSETAWTDFKYAPIISTINSSVAFMVPYLSAILLSVACFYGINLLDLPRLSQGFGIFYGLVLVLILSVGYLTLVKRPNPGKSGSVKRTV